MDRKAVLETEAIHQSNSQVALMLAEQLEHWHPIIHLPEQQDGTKALHHPCWDEDSPEAS